MKKIYAISLLTLLLSSGSILSQEKAENKEEGAAKEKLVKRRVLVLNFVDLGERHSQAEYLSVSIPEAIITSLNKTDSFEVLSLDETNKIARKAGVHPKDFYDEQKAIKVAQEAKVDVVLMGNYFVVTDKRNIDAMQIQVKVLDVHTGRNRVTVTKANEISASVFSTISEIAKEVTGGMVKELPPLTEREIQARRNLDTGGRTYPFVPNLTFGAIFTFGMTPQVKGAEFSGVGGRLFLEMGTPRFMTIFLIMELEGWYGTEKLSDTSILFGSAHMGTSYPVSITKQIVMSPYIMGGIFTGLVLAGQDFFLIPAVKPGVNVKYKLTEKTAVNAHLAMPYMLDPSGYFLGIDMGVSYSIKF